MRALLIPCMSLCAALVLGCDKADEEPAVADATVAEADAGLPGETFSNPPEIAPDGNGVRTLNFGPSEVTIDGQRYCLRAYNGVVPGPTIRVAPGDDRRIRVDLHNDFTTVAGRQVSGKEGREEITCHDFNLTNLHFHGSHIQPNFATPDPNDVCTGEGCGEDDRYYGDNVLITVAQGESAKYRWDLDEDGPHHEGTNWYHPHIHGATAIQVLNGAVGAIIVEGPTDQVPSVAATKERVMVITELPLSNERTRPLADGEDCTEQTLSIDNFLSVTEGMPIQVNGMVKPRMKTPPGQVERWRMVYAGTPDEMAMKLHPGNDANCDSYDRDTVIQLTQFARDGLTMPRYFKNDAVWVSPGYRVDAFVQAPDSAQVLCLVGRHVKDLEGTVLAIFDVDPAAGTPTTTTFPNEAEVTAHAPPTTFMGTVDGVTREVTCENVETVHQRVGLLMPPVDNSAVEIIADGGECEVSHDAHGGHGGGAEAEAEEEAPICQCPSPNINCRKFEQRRARGYRSDRIGVVGTTEKWQIVAFDGHPYHIHINPFLVCANDSNKEPNFPHWRDTFWVQAEDGPRDVLMHFKRFSGRLVQHCHKLNHEDEGMMEVIELCAPDDMDCQCLGFDDSGACISQAGCTEDDTQCHFAAAVTEAYPAPPNFDMSLCGEDPPGPPPGPPGAN
jgi:FtsP/CotA-like multicopper oxidase with cupredoxin domain